MAFSRLKYENAVAKYSQTYELLDQELCDLCHRYPTHSDPATVTAKLWIIGRTYATGIERKIPTNGKQGGSMSQLVGHLLRHGAELDRLFARFQELGEPLDPAALRTVIDVHGQYMHLLKPVLRSNQSPRSFASKYMHFHCPVVPIIDTIAQSALRASVHWHRSFKIFDLPAHADEAYARYALRFWQLYQQAVADGVRPKVKHLDYYLLCAAEEQA